MSHEWTPNGTPGKWALDHEGNVYTWNVNDYDEPHHYEVLHHENAAKYGDITPEGHLHGANSWVPDHPSAFGQFDEMGIDYDIGRPDEEAMAHVERETGLKRAPGGYHFGAIDPTLRDPNENWASGIAPPEPNARIDYNDPLNWARENGEGQTVTNNAAKIDTGWAKIPDERRQEEAIENAFRVVLLSPQKNLRWNAIHYQDLTGIRSSDPVDYWNTLEQRRQEHNVANYGEAHRFSHRPYWKLEPELKSLIYQKDPTIGQGQPLQTATDHYLFDMKSEIEEKIVKADEDVDPKKQKNNYEIENEANKLLTYRLEQILAEYRPEMDVEQAPKLPPAKVKGLERLKHLEGALKPPKPIEGDQPMFNTVQQVVQPRDKYGAFIGEHLKAIAQVHEHVKEILTAAKEDVADHDGSGHHFRAAVMQLGIPGIGPKTASFAWLLLQPLTSELGTIDTHMMDVLGYKPEGNQKTVPTRDYFRLERELRARLDAAGYGSMPLGQGQWAMWDAKRTGPETHQDHSALKALDPTGYKSVIWEETENNPGIWPGPEWWQITEPYGKEVGDAYNENEAKGVAKGNVPYRVEAKFKVAQELRTPWFTHPLSHERIEGQPGETLMQHLTTSTGLSTPEIWRLVEEAGKA